MNLKRKLKAIDYALDDIDIWDRSEQELIDIVYKMYKNDKTKWIFEDIEASELDDLVLQYLREWTDYYSPIDDE